jgi:heme/copper-type cytochrome/quinol oxidase subunit 2
MDWLMNIFTKLWCIVPEPGPVAASCGVWGATSTFWITGLVLAVLFFLAAIYLIARFDEKGVEGDDFGALFMISVFLIPFWWAAVPLLGLAAIATGLHELGARQRRRALERQKALEAEQAEQQAIIRQVDRDLKLTN